MVELFWKGKQKLEPTNLIYPNFSSQHLYTFESSRRVNQPDNPPPYSTSTWHNRLILGDKSSILPALLRNLLVKSISYTLTPRS